MLKRMIAAMLLTMMIFSLCSCDIISKEPSTETKSDLPAEEEIPKPEKISYTVHFDENEIFPDENSKKASEIIDPSIETAIKMLNTIPEQEYEILGCDYKNRPTEKDKLSADEAAIFWYEFIYEKMSAIDDFCLYPEDYGGEEALYFPFYTAESALMIDHREIFLCGTTWMDEEDGRIYPIYFMPGDWVDNPCYDKEEIKAGVAVYDRIVDRIFEKMPSGLTNYQKVCYFSFVITAAAEYDHNYEGSASVFTPYDTLVKGKTVCRGYAFTFYELCRREGISCWYCEGMVPSGFHAWNRIDTVEGSLWIDLTGFDNEKISSSYSEGDTEYLFMTEEDTNYLEYHEGAFE